MFDIEQGRQRRFWARFTDARGNQAVVDGAPLWTIDSTEFNLVQSTDGLSVVVQAVGTIIGSTANLTVDADADLGAGVAQITKTEEVRIVAGAAAGIEIEADPSEPIA